MALGATALYTLLGRSLSVTKARGRVIQSTAGYPILVTIHPSYLLRIRSRTDAEIEHRRFVADLHQVLELLEAT